MTHVLDARAVAASTAGRPRRLLPKYRKIAGGTWVATSRVSASIRARTSMSQTSRWPSWGTQPGMLAMSVSSASAAMSSELVVTGKVTKLDNGPYLDAEDPDQLVDVVGRCIHSDSG